MLADLIRILLSDLVRITLLRSLSYRMGQVGDMNAFLSHECFKLIERINSNKPIRHMIGSYSTGAFSSCYHCSHVST